MLHAIGREDLHVPCVATDWDGDHHSPLRMAEPRDDRLVHLRERDRLLELRLSSLEQRRIPFELRLLDEQLFELGHARSLGSEDAGGGTRTRTPP